MSVTEAPQAQADETLALPAGDQPFEAPRPRGASNIATALFVAGDLMVLCGLVGALYAMRGEAFVVPAVLLGRTTSGEYSSDDHDPIPAAAIFWQFVNLAGLVAYSVLFVHP